MTSTANRRAVLAKAGPTPKVSRPLKPRRMRPAKVDDAPVARLSFVATRDGKVLPKPKGSQWPRCFWNVKPTGDYGKDNWIGIELALEYLAYEETNQIGLRNLQHIVMDMPRDLTGVEVGFLSTVATATAGGADRAREQVAYYKRCWNEMDGKLRGVAGAARL